MRKILIAECKQEVSTFNPVLSHYEDFVVTRGQAILDYHRGKRSEIGGALTAFDTTSDIEIVPVLRTRHTALPLFLPPPRLCTPTGTMRIRCPGRAARQAMTARR